MANVKITDLTEDTTPADGDWVETVDISASASKKVTRTNFFLDPPYGAGSIDDAALKYGKLRHRQGGSATIWTTQGTNNYDYYNVNVFAQSGTLLIDANPKAITFPAAFNQNPHVFVQVLTQVGANCYAIAASISTTGFNCAVITDSGVANTGQTVNWWAIGQ